ncbi:MAG: pantetheine-phosphate adenylyltransferase [Clostridia bacterium]|nr:pantetheine-phosphate adenylyltransferase [Clostridia bacterium]
MRIAVYPGSFDPVTNGHLDIIIRAADKFDKLVVAVLRNSAKQPTFTVEERMDMLRRVTAAYPQVEIDTFDGLLVDYLHHKQAGIIVKGLRAMSDFEYEFQMALMNKKLAPDIETLFMVTSDKYSFLSSSIVRELASYNGSLEGLVPELLEDEIRRKIYHP